MPDLSLLDTETINQAELLGLAARKIVEGYMSGEHKSPFRGFSVEFSQHREYVPGDDTRHLDWKLLGRTDRYYLKQYEQETNFVAHILVDGSASMKYGSGTPGNGPTVRGHAPAKITKFDYARGMAACLAYLILNQRDAVSVGVFDTSMRDYLPRTGNLGSIHDVMVTLSRFQPTQTTGIGSVLNAVAGQIRRRGIVILISDLLDDEEKILQGVQRLGFGGSETIVFHLMDPYELEFPFNSNTEFVGLEAAAEDPTLKTRPNEIRRGYLRELNAFRERMKLGCERMNTHLVQVNTGKPMHETLSAYLASRAMTR